MTTDGTYLYVNTSGNVIVKYRISDQNVIDTYTSGHNNIFLSIFNNRLFIGDNTNVYDYDITIFSSPVLKNTINQATSPRGMTTDTNYNLYITDFTTAQSGAGVIDRYNFTPPPYPCFKEDTNILCFDINNAQEESNDYIKLQ
jgi:hypothetical protein